MTNEKHQEDNKIRTGNLIYILEFLIYRMDLWNSIVGRATEEFLDIGEAQFDLTSFDNGPYQLVVYLVILKVTLMLICIMCCRCRRRRIRTLTMKWI
ncbi:putative accessory protein [Plumbago necrotic spot associated virus]|nr:putative accessory protein [Plumbago necrotic spot associated virus]